jgi:hypothetical protein
MTVSEGGPQIFLGRDPGFEAMPLAAKTTEYANFGKTSYLQIV